jgi:hypothetical protein
MNHSKLLQQAIGVMLAMVFLVGCGSPAVTPVSEAPPATSTPEPLAATPMAAPQTPRLRITNAGTMAVEDLTVLFPEDEIKFGDIPPGTTTDYQDVPNGVYGYAAYRFEIDGKGILQPVTDWVGEEPWGGKAFTYTIGFDSNRPQGMMVQLIEVTIDE